MCGECVFRAERVLCMRCAVLCCIVLCCACVVGLAKSANPTKAVPLEQRRKVR